jgi:hypothetical protein
VPDVTPNGNPVNVGVIVATPAVPVPEAAVGECICEAVVIPVKPEKLTWTSIVCNRVSIVTRVLPVAGELLAGDSLGPVRKVA